MSDQEQLYIKGFNSGYLLEKHMPTFFATLTKNIVAKDEFTEGLLNGSKEFKLENAKVQAEELNRLRNKSKNRERGFEKE